MCKECDKRQFPIVFIRLRKHKVDSMFGFMITNGIKCSKRCFMNENKQRLKKFPFIRGKLVALNPTIFMEFKNRKFPQFCGIISTYNNAPCRFIEIYILFETTVLYHHNNFPLYIFLLNFAHLFLQFTP